MLSRLPLDAGARAASALPWADCPGPSCPRGRTAARSRTRRGQAALRLSSRAHWDVPVMLPGGGRLHLLASNPTPPLFDGAEGFNRRRNRDEVRFWSAYLDGAACPTTRAAGRRPAGRAAGGARQPQPRPARRRRRRARRWPTCSPSAAPGPRPASRRRRGGRRAPAPTAATTATRRSTPPTGATTAGPATCGSTTCCPRPSCAVAGAGVFWPAPGEPLAEAARAASDHRLVWVDVGLP